MPIVKITQKGWETFNGEMEGTQFRNGVSVEAMSYMSAERLGCSLSLVDADTGKPISSTQRVLDCQGQDIAPGRWTTPVTKDEGEAKEEKPEDAPKSETKDEKPEVYPYTREQLEAIADKGGITELREFAKDYKVNGTSIVGIIDALMAKKAQ